MAQGSLDRRRRMGETESSGVSRCVGLGTAAWGKLGRQRSWNRKGHGSRLLELSYETFHAQSQPISSRAYLLQGMEERKQRYPDKDTVSLPDSLQGVYLYPTEIDVWHGSPDDRLHDRRLFPRTATGWSFCTLVS